MISKIRMNGVACYKCPAELETNKKTNIVYGLNGTGKSTISNFLYDPAAVSFDKCSVDVNEDEKVLVYNQQFVRDYFYEADSLKGVFSLSKENKEIEQKLIDSERSLVALNEQSVELTGALTVAQETQQRDAAQAAEKVWDIRRQYSGGDRVLEYCLTGLMGKKESLFNHICALEKPSSKPTRNISAIKRDVNSISADNAQAYDALPTVDFDQLLVETNEVFSLVILGNEDSIVSDLIAEMDNSDWVRGGIGYMRTPVDDNTEPCPFCQERTITGNLAEEIRGYFDSTFDESVNLVASLLDRYENASQRLSSLDSMRQHPLAEARLLELTEAHAALEKLVTENLAKIREKKLSPSLPVELSNTSSAVKALNEILEAINKDVVSHNERLENVDSELVALKGEFWSLMRWEYDQTISSWESNQVSRDKLILEKQAEINLCSALIAAARSEISNLQKSTVNIQAAIDSINTRLGELGITSFSIENYTESKYRIVRTEESAAEFSSLSEGEKMIISFLYFCEVCKGKQSADESVGKKIVVIDDPISSLSHVFVFNIAQLIRREFFTSDSYEQVFVLTHSLYFFYELADSNHDRRGKTQRLFRLTKNTDGSSVKKMKYEEVQNDYQSYWSIVTDPDQPPALIANCMRNIIEYFFNFVQKADFSNVIQKPELQDHRFQAFCRYVSRESHSLGQNIFDYKEFDYDDFREGLKLVFDATGYPEHYEKMTAVFST